MEASLSFSSATCAAVNVTGSLGKGIRDNLPEVEGKASRFQAISGPPPIDIPAEDVSDESGLGDGHNRCAQRLTCRRRWFRLPALQLSPGEWPEGYLLSVALAARLRRASELLRKVSGGACCQAVNQMSPSNWPDLSSWPSRNALPSNPFSPTPESLPSLSNW